VAAVREAGGEALSLAFDVRDAEATREAYERAESELGPMAAVVANAGVADRLTRPRPSTRRPGGPNRRST
jgi:NAD(P)-dependent dehydrogenase (short-subunit alcohol dehydrogenase family)